MLRVAVSSPRSVVLRTTFHRAYGYAIGERSLATVAQPQQNESFPELKEIPSLPFVGSRLPFYSGIRPMPLKEGNVAKYWRDLHKENGPFYSVGLPGIGHGVRGTIHVVRDPQTMMKVLKQEGSFPSGAVQDIWPSIETLRMKGFSSVGLFEKGPEWQRLRRAIQQDLFSPQSARGYLNEILHGAKLASQKALKPQFQSPDGIHRFLNFAALDMFAGVLFGGSDHMGDDYEPFCEAAVDSLGQINDLLLSVPEQIAYKVFGYTSPRFQRFQDTFDVVNEISMRCLMAFREHVEGVGEEGLTEAEKSSYFYKLLQRQEESNITEKECMELSVILMNAAVDTTAAKTSWNILHLALRPDIQDKLREQIESAVARHGGLVPTIFDNVNEYIPLLPAFIRESHRCTPTIFGDIRKALPVDTEVYGKTLPAGSCVIFDALTNMMDESLVEDPMDFKPERWLKEAVEARKNTPQAIIDHPFYSGPFSQGARRCPGSRVAYVEIQAFLSQMLLDYTISGPSGVHWNDIDGELRLFEVAKFPEELAFVPRG